MSQYPDIKAIDTAPDLADGWIRIIITVHTPQQFDGLLELVDGTTIPLEFMCGHVSSIMFGVRYDTEEYPDLLARFAEFAHVPLEMLLQNKR